MQGYRLVLSRPMKAGNIGSCARLVSNFALEDLVLVAPVTEWRGSKDAENYATPSGRAALESIRETESLFDAVSDCHVAVGFTRRDGLMRRPTITLDQVGRLGAELKVALIFGNEKSGLNSDELDLCTHTCFIPTGPANPSLNLSHAVAIVCARVFEAQFAKAKPSLKSFERPELADFEALMNNWSRYLQATGFEGNQNPERILRRLRKIFGRVELTKSEINLLHVLLRHGTQ